MCMVGSLHVKKQILSGKWMIKPISLELNLGPNDLAIETHSIGVCTSDCRSFSEGVGDYFGHEIIGTALNCSGSIRKGDIVYVPYRRYCGRCQYCQQDQNHLCINQKSLDVGFQDFIRIPENDKTSCYLRKIPNIKHVECYAFIDSVASVSHGVTSLPHLEAAQSVLLLGNGFMGLLFYFILMSLECKVTIIGRKTMKSKFPQFEVNEKINAYPYDVLIDTTGDESFINTYLDFVKSHGDCLVFSRLRENSRLHIEKIRLREIRLIFSRYYTQKDVDKSIEYIRAKIIPMDTLITRQYKPKALEAALQDTIDRKILRGIIRYQ